MNTVPGLPGMHAGAEKTRSNPWRGQQYAATQPYETTLPAAITWDVGLQQVRLITLAANTTITFPTNAQRGATYILILKQDATGSRTMTWSNQAAGLGAGTWAWSGGTAPTLTTTASKRDVITFVFDGVDMIGTSVLNF